MRYASAASTDTDPYRAGIEIGAGLRPLVPEIVLLFASISYDPDFSDFFSGLQDALEGQLPIVVGGTGDGIFEAGLAANYGISALGINSDGAVRWSTGFSRGVRADSRAAARLAAREALRQAGDPSGFCLVFADGTRADGTQIVAGVRECLSTPFVGGLTGDDRKFTRSRVFHDWQEYADAVVVCIGTGSIPFLVNAASGWVPLGEAGVVQDCDGRTVRTISGMTAQGFMMRQIGKPLGETDLGLTPLATYEAGATGHFSLRAPSAIDYRTGEVTTFGSILPGTGVRVCSASRGDVLAGVAAAVAGLGPRPEGFVPGAAIVISCAGRKWLLDDNGTKELETLFGALEEKLPLAGFPSFGEIGPCRLPDGTYTPTSFHNETFVVCLLGR